MNPDVTSFNWGAKDNPDGTGSINRAAENLKFKIPEMMEEDKPFLDPDLTLARFSAALKASPAAVSGIINREFHCNFSDYVNQYRVNEAKKLLKDPSYQHYKLEAIGTEAGFSNKVSFNRVFKKHTGSTPSQLKASVDK